jgi:hypothetical protein
MTWVVVAEAAQADRLALAEKAAEARETNGYGQ